MESQQDMESLQENLEMALSLLTGKLIACSIANVLENGKMEPNAIQMIYTMPYCRRTANCSGRVGTRNLATKVPVLRWMVVLMLT